ncbi:uncharacterized protein LOC116215582 [Punica granatum]|uniref:Uncharacterized protein n=2 Tax=Punica granatum TaxID=22663 RepID=A0A218VQX8_PUNGR|nr:uncharacterized protein LOC116215582 [Punica granatum]OWM62905.1 hypothetical protein CDL15_Pgr020199 [Punica granatum]PKI37728.1 hypothetical protein CRG98_041879 [Punica granatum]
MDLEAPSSNNGEETANVSAETHQSLAFEDFDSNCSTPYVSAPSSPGRGPPFGGGGGGGYYYSAPASPMHFALTSGAVKLYSQPSSPHENGSIAMSSSSSFEFGLFGPLGMGHTGSMSSADELFLDGKIRPMKLSTHLERPQVLAPLPDLDTEDEDDPKESDPGAKGGGRGRDLRLREKSLRRRTRSMSPFRSMPFEWNDDGDKTPPHRIDQDQVASKIEEALSLEASENRSVGTPSVSASSSRSSSAGRSSKRWVFLKDFLRSKSEGRSNNKFWATISFSPAKEKTRTSTTSASSAAPKEKQPSPPGAPNPDRPKRNPGKKPGKPVNGAAAKRRVPPSPHELHYTAHRAQAEELRKKTFLPYRQGLLGCLGFSSKGYGAMNGFARALNPVSSR